MSIFNDIYLLAFYAEWLRQSINIKDKSSIRFCLDKIFKMDKSSTMLYYTLNLDILVNRAREILREQDDGGN